MAKSRRVTLLSLLNGKVYLHVESKYYELDRGIADKVYKIRRNFDLLTQREQHEAMKKACAELLPYYRMGCEPEINAPCHTIISRKYCFYIPIPDGD